MVPSLQFSTLPCVTSFYGSSSRSYHLKPRLEKASVAFALCNLLNLSSLSFFDFITIFRLWCVLKFGLNRSYLTKSCKPVPMDIDLSTSVDVNNCHGLYIHTPESTQNLSVDKLGNNVTQFLNIQDDKDVVPGSKPPHGKYEKYFSNPTFICSIESTLSPGASVEAITVNEPTPCDNLKSVHPTCSHPPSLPTAWKPVSAMKGSREKRGVTPPQKLTVKWAPDVYDPVPTSVSHTVTNRNNKPQRQTKKNTKSKQKNGNKSSRGSGSKYKDKKQGRKRGGDSSTAGFKLPEQEEEAVGDGDYGLPPPAAMEFHVGNPDQFCGTGFLNRYDANQICVYFW
ncbi:unnamed protein product [Lactuca saligna]|uniref:Uncharacterized protein n=1 Tax=Lactuca saligna TaxID=75948 RepID=A0AA35VKS4_LACSI|nr:unnamed protein product [Lactuca saligna]